MGSLLAANAFTARQHGIAAALRLGLDHLPVIARATQPTPADIGEIIGPVAAIFVIVAAILWMVIASLGIGAGWLMGLARRRR
jgi:hypothetical protein